MDIFLDATLFSVLPKSVKDFFKLCGLSTEVSANDVMAFQSALCYAVFQSTANNHHTSHIDFYHPDSSDMLSQQYTTNSEDKKSILGLAGAQLMLEALAGFYSPPNVERFFKLNTKVIVVNLLNIASSILDMATFCVRHQDSDNDWPYVGFIFCLAASSWVIVVWIMMKLKMQQPGAAGREITDLSQLSDIDTLVLNAPATVRFIIESSASLCDYLTSSKNKDNFEQYVFYQSFVVRFFDEFSLGTLVETITKNYEIKQGTLSTGSLMALFLAGMTISYSEN